MPLHSSGPGLLHPAGEPAAQVAAGRDAAQDASGTSAATSVCEQKTLLLCEPWPRNSSAETALLPLIWCSDSLSSHVSASPEECFLHRHRYHGQCRLSSSHRHSLATCFRTARRAHASVCAALGEAGRHDLARRSEMVLSNNKTTAFRVVFHTHTHTDGHN